MSEDSFKKNSYGRRDDNQEPGQHRSRAPFHGERSFRRSYRQGEQRPFNKSYQAKTTASGNRTEGYIPNREGQPFRPSGASRFSAGQKRSGDFSQERRYTPQGGAYSSRSYGEHGAKSGSPHFNRERSVNAERPFGQREGGKFPKPFDKSRTTAGGQSYERKTPAFGVRPQGKRPFPGKQRVHYKELILDPSAPLRLNKYLANAGVCSRRDADKYINAGVVTVNGNVVTELGTKIYRTDEVRFHGEVVRLEKKVYVLLNKPKGYVTTSDDPQNRKTVMDLVRNACPERIYPVGRLDRNTTGVLLLTNDGELASKLTHPKFLKKKIYHVYLDQNVTAAHLREIAEGVTLEDGEIKADQIDYASPTDKKQVGIEIHSGRNRIVRRIFESLGYHVTKLDRVYFSGLTKKNLRRGDWRYLTEQEVNMLRMGAFE